MNWPANRMRNDNPLKLGIFSPNCSGGMAVTTVPERWDPSWDNNAALAVMADGYGIEFLLPIARWRGYGGETNFQGTTLETMTYHHYAVDNQDADGVSRLMELQGLHAQSFPPEAFALFRERFAAGHGVYPLVGDPDHIASELERVHRAGFDGTTISFVDYLAELPYFAEEVIPRLEAKGLRSPVPSA